MYDAVGVKRRYGEHTVILEDLIHHVQQAGVSVSDAVLSLGAPRPYAQGSGRRNDTWLRDSGLGLFGSDNP